MRGSNAERSGGAAPGQNKATCPRGPLTRLPPCAADIELGLKRDALGPADGSSLEALLKGEPLDRRGGAAAEVRGPEEDPVPEPVAASASTHTSSGRIRKVRAPPSLRGAAYRPRVLGSVMVKG